MDTKIEQQQTLSIELVRSDNGRLSHMDCFIPKKSFRGRIQKNHFPEGFCQSRYCTNPRNNKATFIVTGKTLGAFDCTSNVCKACVMTLVDPISTSTKERFEECLAEIENPSDVWN